MASSGVYIRAQDESGKWGSLDLIYEVDNIQFLDWVGHKIAESGGIFAVDAELQKSLTIDVRFELLHMLKDHDIEVVYLKGSEYARQVVGLARQN